jgi:hypothetical protein
MSLVIQSAFSSCDFRHKLLKSINIRARCSGEAGASDVRSAEPLTVGSERALICFDKKGA